MKKTLLTMLLACSLCAQASELPPANQAPTPTPAAGAKTSSAKAVPARSKEADAAEAAVVEQFISLQDAAIATFLELGDTLQGVTDRKSADEAAPTVKMASEQLCTIINAVEALGAPSEAAEQAIMARVANVSEKNEVVEQVMLPLLTLMMQEPPCYGSESLLTELSNLLTSLQGAAGVDEEDVQEAEDGVDLREPDADEPAEAGAK